MLTNEQITTLWNHFDAPGWAKWHKDYLELITWAREASEAELRTEGAQKKLWNARAITQAGYGDAINVGALIADPEVVDAIVRLRSRAWPADTAARAAAIQGEFEGILAMAVARGLKASPFKVFIAHRHLRARERWRRDVAPRRVAHSPSALWA